MLLMVEEAEGYAGLSAAEQELDKMLEANLLGAGRVCSSRSPRIKRFALEDDLAGAGSHPTGGDNSGDAGLTMIAEHGNVASWGNDHLSGPRTASLVHRSQAMGRGTRCRWKLGPMN